MKSSGSGYGRHLTQHRQLADRHGGSDVMWFFLEKRRLRRRRKQAKRKAESDPLAERLFRANMDQMRSGRPPDKGGRAGS